MPPPELWDREDASPKENSLPGDKVASIAALALSRYDSSVARGIEAYDFSSGVAETFEGM